MLRLTYRTLFVAAGVMLILWVGILFFAMDGGPRDAGPLEDRLPFTCDKVSLVYTWVNGSDPEHIKARNKRSGNMNYASPSNNRFRDLGGLLYSLRSAEMYAPWVAGIYIITNGQVPSFLDTSNPHVHIITHDQIFPNKSDLPTFSSNAIEASLHNLPDSIGDCFIYLNDDMFFANHVTPSDFYNTQTHTQTLYKSSWTAPPPRSRMGNAWHRSIAHSNELLNRIWGYAYSRNYASHGPYFFSMKVLRRMYAELRAEFDVTTAHPFRHEQDVSIPFLYNQFTYHYYQSTMESSINMYFKIIDDRSRMSKEYDKILSRQPKTVCMNDGLSDRPDPRVITQMHQFFHKMFPDKSQYELHEDEFL